MPTYPYRCSDGVWRNNPFTGIRFPDYDARLTMEEHDKVDRFIKERGLTLDTRPATWRRRTPNKKGGEKDVK